MDIKKYLFIFKCTFKGKRRIKSLKSKGHLREAPDDLLHSSFFLEFPISRPRGSRGWSSRGTSL